MYQPERGIFEFQPNSFVNRPKSEYEKTSIAAKEAFSNVNQAAHLPTHQAT
jgi:hypothetical protein